MADTTLERVLHQKCPEWDNSIRAARSACGFSFKLSDGEIWEWLVSGGHARVRKVATTEVQKLRVEEFYEYYLCCFYSDYELSGGTIDFEAIQGPPWVSFSCPVATHSSKWRESIENAQAALYSKLGLAPPQDSKAVSGEFLSWFFYNGGANEVAELALEHMGKLGMEDINSVLWVCCLLPPGAKYMVSKSAILLERFPYLMEWDQFGALCESNPIRRRVRAYPSHIDWNEGVPPPTDLPILPQKAGIQYKIERGSKTILGITWDPLVVSSEADLCEAMRALHRHYKYRYHEHNVRQALGILPRISAKKRRGGRPQWEQYRMPLL